MVAHRAPFHPKQKTTRRVLTNIPQQLLAQVHVIKGLVDLRVVGGDLGAIGQGRRRTASSAGRVRDGRGRGRGSLSGSRAGAITAKTTRKTRAGSRVGTGEPGRQSGQHDAPRPRHKSTADTRWPPAHEVCKNSQTTPEIRASAHTSQDWWTTTPAVKAESETGGSNVRFRHDWAWGGVGTVGRYGWRRCEERRGDGGAKSE